ASQNAMAEHEYLRLPNCEIPALAAEPSLDVTEIGSGRVGAGIACPVAAALSRAPDSLPCIGVEYARFAWRVRVTHHLR
ncbi:hypothetical protein QN416_26960, partial [Glaciimonas sp. Cout2]|uniref:hypothetical protein n=1 Tax=Glaciimonas sp. Cout2 TaxID=3048621 RepID=UPI002B23B5B5